MGLGGIGMGVLIIKTNANPDNFSHLNEWDFNFVPGFYIDCFYKIYTARNGKHGSLKKIFRSYEQMLL